MKKLLTILVLMLVAFNTHSQCPVEPSCSTSWLVTSGLNNQNFTQNICIYGQGIIHQSVNFNVPDYAKFEASTGNMHVLTPINMNIINFTNMWLRSEYCYDLKLNYVSMGGGDTIITAEYSNIIINNIVSNNSIHDPTLSPPLGYNVIIKGIASTLKVEGQYYDVGDTIVTVPGNPSNNVYVLDCYGTPLPINIIEFKITGNVLSWIVEGVDNIEIQYSEDGKSQNFKSIHYTSVKRGELILERSGFYRIKSEDVYSKVLQYNMSSLKVFDNNYIYYHMGVWYKTPPNVEVYGRKKLR